MTTQAQTLLQELYHLTKTIDSNVQYINVDMDKNDDKQLEGLEGLISKRGEIIGQLAPIIKSEEIEWTTAEQEIIQRIKEWELSFQPRLEKIFEAFSSQIRKLQQGKQISQRYFEGYGDVYADGVYFDKRK
jgi:ABC-type cobalt transport system substrate-binding protein